MPGADGIRHKKNDLGRGCPLKDRTPAVEVKGLQKEHVWLPRTLRLRLPMPLGTAVVGHSSKEAVSGLWEEGKGAHKMPWQCWG